MAAVIIRKAEAAMAKTAREYQQFGGLVNPDGTIPMRLPDLDWWVVRWLKQQILRMAFERGRREYRLKQIKGYSKKVNDGDWQE